MKRLIGQILTVKAHSLVGGMALFSLLLAGCSRDEERGGMVDVKFAVQAEDALSVTRVDGYHSFTSADYAGDLAVYALTSTTLDEGVALYDGSTWTSTLRLEMGTYQFFSYLPKQSSGGSLTREPAGPTLHLTAYPGFSDSDLLVSHAAEHNGTTPVLNNYRAVLDTDHKRVDFLMDHLLSKVTVKFALGAGYGTLRQVEITSVALESNSNNSTSYDVDCTFGNTALSSTWTATGSGKESRTVPYAGNETSLAGDGTKAMLLATTAKEFTSFYMVPAMANTLKLTVTYNVYDRSAGNVETRENQTAVNASLLLTNSSADPLAAGTHYTLTVTVVPSYLYVLSDTDQQNPYIVLN